MIRKIKNACVSTIIVFSITSSSTHALTIITDYVPSGNILPGIGTAGGPSSNTLGGGHLQTIFNAAASMWEQLIQDEFTLVLHYGWYPTKPVSSSAYHLGIAENSTLERETEGSIAFNNDNNGTGDFRFFLDPTPQDNSEFTTLNEDFQNLGGGLINTRRDFAPSDPDTMGSIDLLTTALHEIGHALGMSGWHHFLTEVSDGDIDVNLPPYEGTTIPMRGTHIAVDGTLMSHNGSELGHRNEITQLDLLAVCQLSQFSGGALCKPSMTFSADFDASGDVDENDFLLWRSGFGTLDIAEPIHGDADLNGNVDGSDLMHWQGEYRSAGGASSMNVPVFLESTIDVPAVPEPVGWVSALLVLVTCITWSKRP